MPASLIAIVDDDASVRGSLFGLIRSYGYAAAIFDSAEALLASGTPALCGCIITDLQMLGMSGLDLKERLVQLGCTCPMILITAHADPEVLERVRHGAAFCCIPKPFRAEQLIGCVERALRAGTPPAT